MSKIQKLFLSVLLLLPAANILATGITYTYTGEEATNTQGTYVGIGAHVSGQFTVAEQLPPSKPETDISSIVSSYSFSDGVQTLTEADSKLIRFVVVTDSNGVPRTWFLTLYKTPVTSSNGGQVEGIELFNTGSVSLGRGSTDAVCNSNSGPGGECDSSFLNTGSNFGEIVLSPSLSRAGTWSCSGCVSIPIPAGQVWTELTDAPSFPDQVAQLTRGSGALTALVGATNAGAGDFRDA